MLDLLPAGTFSAYLDSISFSNGNTYRFSFQQIGPVWRAYILAQPSYGARAADALTTHRLTDSADQYYVCWSPEPTTFPDVRVVATQWAARTERYLQMGTALAD